MSSLTSRVVASLGWIFTNILAKNAVQFVRTVVLWRFLSAEEFGLNSLAWMIIGGFTLLQDMGFSQELIQRKTDLDKAVSVTWYANVVIRAVIYGLIYVFAPFLAEHFNQTQAKHFDAAEVVSILRVASLAIVISSFGSTNEALLRKNFQFKRVLAVDGAEMTVLTVVQIALAWAGYGVWSLVYGTIVAFSVRSLALWWLAPIRVGRFDVRVFKEMFHFGKHMTLSTLGLWLIKNMDYYFVGRYLGLAALGYYTLAFKLSDLIAVNVVRNLASVLFPAYSELKQDLERLRGAWLRSVRYTMLLVMPMGLGLMLFSREIILAFYPGKEVVIFPMAILVIFSLCRGVGVPLGDLAKAIGRPKILTQAVIVHILLMGPALYLVTAWLGLDLDRGLIAVSIVVAAAPILAVQVSYRLAARHVKFTAKQVLGALLPSVAAGAFMAAGTLAVKAGLLWVAPGTPALVILVALGSFSCLLYALALLKLFPETARDLRDLFQRRRRKEKVGAASAAAAPR